MDEKMVTGKSKAEFVADVRNKTIYSPSGLPYVVHISDPPTTEERLQLAACRLLRQPIVLVPGKCLSIEEWVEKYGEQGSADRQ